MPGYLPGLEEKGISLKFVTKRSFRGSAFILLLIITMSTLLAGCGGDATATNTPFAGLGAATATSAATTAAGTAAPGATTAAASGLPTVTGDPTKTSSGLQYIDTKVGDGAEAKAGSQVTVNYTGYLTNGTVFDTSLKAGRSPFPFTLGAGQVIKGWDEGVAGMKVNGKRRLIIPPELGYGASGQGSIPPNSQLIFDVELLSVK